MAEPTKDAPESRLPLNEGPKAAASAANERSKVMTAVGRMSVVKMGLSGRGRGCSRSADGVECKNTACTNSGALGLTG